MSICLFNQQQFSVKAIRELLDSKGGHELIDLGDYLRTEEEESHFLKLKKGAKKDSRVIWTHESIYIHKHAT